MRGLWITLYRQHFSRMCVPGVQYPVTRSAWCYNSTSLTLKHSFLRAMPAHEMTCSCPSWQRRGLPARSLPHRRRCRGRFDRARRRRCAARAAARAVMRAPTKATCSSTSRLGAPSLAPPPNTPTHRVVQNRPKWTIAGGGRPRPRRGRRPPPPPRRGTVCLRSHPFDTT